jgi:hypothetical protein
MSPGGPGDGERIANERCREYEEIAEVSLSVTLIGVPKEDRVTVKNLSANPGSQIYLLGESKPLGWLNGVWMLRLDCLRGFPGVTLTC